ncbi:uncharacterized protein TNCV_2606061 [Trichonephila clavipes]|nr:uncharacterized protein TNCV_2606061 [Trichonephila clavipes]
MITSHEKFSNSLQKCGKENKLNRLWCPIDNNGRSSFTCRNCGGGDRGRVAIYRPFGEVSLSLNRTVTCMVLKANDRRTSCPCHDEFRGPRSDYVRQQVLLLVDQLQLPSIEITDAPRNRSLTEK